ncbi:MAG: nitroreductase family protein [Clostridiales bacterium]|nr:nitroreductase family protein [Clostridiales bacterium]
MSNQTITMIKKRRSHRSYDHQQINADQLEALMSAALHSPSARDLQPWHFSFVQNKELLSQINTAAHHQARLLSDANRSARFLDADFDVFYHAPTVVIISSAEGSFSPVDCGIAAQTLALAAESLGLGSVIVGLANFAFTGTDRAVLEEALHFPQDYHFVISIAIGFPTDEKAPHPLDPEKITLIQ